MTGKQDSEAAFKEVYNSLNDAQKQAVDTIEGPVMVVAGPGTGKTQVLTLRIANILRQSDTEPEQILALTFTESGARAMRLRLRQFIGSAAYRVTITTFHGLAEQLISQYPEYYERIISGRAASELERALLIEDILQDPALTVLAPAGDPRYYVKPIMSELSHLKREHVTPEDFARYVNEQAEALAALPRYHESGRHQGKERGEYQKAAKALSKNEALLAVYQRYEAGLQDKQWYDFDDMIKHTVAELTTKPDFQQEIQEQYQYVLADEHQDVNGSQNRLLELLTDYHDQPNLFVVGDEKQAIFRFQGASLDNFLYFEDAHGATTTITLTDNYRSGQTILDAAQAVIAVDDPELMKLRQPLNAVTATQGTIELGSFAHEAVEDEVVVSQIKALIESGTPPEEIAVIVRTNHEVEVLAAALRAAGVLVAASAESDILEHPLTRTVTALVMAAADRQNDAALAHVLHQPQWGIASIDIATVLAARNRGESLAALLGNSDRLAGLPLADEAAVARIMCVLDAAVAAEATTATHRVVAQLIEDSGLLHHATTVAPQEHGRVLRRLYDEIAASVRTGTITSLADVARQFDRLRTYKLSLNAPLITTDATAVAVMTAHKAKGLEFQHVFLPHLNDATWGGRARRQLFSIDLTRQAAGAALGAEDDERRLFYVTLTRAKHAVHLSYANTRMDGRELVASRLLELLPPNLVREGTHDETAFDPTTVLEKPTPASIDANWLTEVLRERGLSATALNNYRTSPWNYLYRNVLRLPEVPNLSMRYGTAVHDVLDQIVTAWRQQETLPTTTELRSLIDRALNRIPLHPEEYTRLHAQALQELTVYLEQLPTQLTKGSRSEVNVTALLPTDLPELPELLLTGMLDRLDFAEDGTLLRVVDYKTGKPKTRNHIEGKTKSSDGNYHRQLVFYALMLSLNEDPSWQCRTGVLSFVQPDSHGAIREETYEITPDEIEALKAELIETAAAITSGTMLHQPCDPEQSDYCDLVAALMQSAES